MATAPAAVFAADKLTDLPDIELRERVARIGYLLRNDARWRSEDPDIRAADNTNRATITAKLDAIVRETARRRAAIIDMPMAGLRVGDIISHTTVGGQRVALDVPRMVTAPLGRIDEGAYGVRLHTTSDTDFVLYTRGVSSVTVVARQRGYATTGGVTTAARRIIGWSANGGCYFQPLLNTMHRNGYRDWGFTGQRGAHNLHVHLVGRGHIVKVGKRWYVTARAHQMAQRWIGLDARAEAEQIERDMRELGPTVIDRAMVDTTHCTDTGHRGLFDDTHAGDICAHIATHLATRLAAESAPTSED